MPGWKGSTRNARLPRGWAKLRAAVLVRDRHVCQLQYLRRCTQVATEVDHIVNNDDHSMGNLHAVCSPCHRLKTAREGHRMQLRRPRERHPGLI